MIEEKINQEKVFKQQMNVIRYLIANMRRIIKDDLLLTEIIEEPHKHPHYESCISTLVYYDEEKKTLMYRESRSGSPSAVNHYDTEIFSIFQLARYIVTNINAINNIASSLTEEDDIDVWTIKIEGV